MGRHGKRHARPKKRHVGAEKRHVGHKRGHVGAEKRHAGAKSPVPGLLGAHFCQVEPRLATIKAWAEKTKAVRSVSIAARRSTKSLPVKSCAAPSAERPKRRPPSTKLSHTPTQTQ